MIEAYEEAFDCRFIVMVDQIMQDSVSLLEELIFDADPEQDLHLLLSTPGGDGEAAVRLVRSAQARCRELTVIVPDQAKSAGTLLAMGANHILMGPTSDLGPVDPQLILERRELVSAKDLIATVKEAEKAITAKPDTFPLHASLLADITAVMVQQARSALARTEDLVDEALRSNAERDEEDIERLKERIKEPLIKAPKQHGAVVSAHDAANMGLPITEVDPKSEQWRLVWLLWSRYLMHGGRFGIYEGRKASRFIPLHTG